MRAGSSSTISELHKNVMVENGNIIMIAVKYKLDMSTTFEDAFILTMVC